MRITGFSVDTRGATTQIGVVLLFGILIVSLSLYQANAVPAENSQVEFNHYQRIQDDMHDLRSTVLNVGSTNQQQSVTLKLGTQYPSRVLAQNAPPPSGHVQARSIGTGRIALSGVNLTAVCGSPQPTTNAIKYTPNYHYLQTTPPITYEHSVLYRQTRDDTVLIESDQALISGQTINLNPLRTNVSRTRSGTMSLDFHGSQTGQARVSEPLTLTLPTQLSPATWETELLAEEPGVKQVVQNTSRPSAVDIELKRDVYTVRCTPTGTGTQPNVAIPDQGTNSEINPGETGSIRLASEHRDQKNVVTLSLNNTAGVDRTLKDARINFYQDVNEQGNPPAYANLTDSTDTTVATLEFRGSTVRTEPAISLTGNGTTTPIKVKFYTETGKEANLDSGDWFVITLRFSEGESSTYFIPVPE